MKDETDDPRARWPSEWWTLLTDKQVCQRYAISRTTLHAKRNADELPKPIHKSPVGDNRTLLGDVIDDLRRRT